MKKKWNAPTLEVLNVKKTFGGKPGNGGNPGNGGWTPACETKNPPWWCSSS